MWNRIGREVLQVALCFGSDNHYGIAAGRRRKSMRTDVVKPGIIKATDDVT
jgi:hypothetical protein